MGVKWGGGGGLGRLRRLNPKFETCPSLTRRSRNDLECVFNAETQRSRREAQRKLRTTKTEGSGQFRQLMAWRLLEGVVHPKGRCSRADVDAGLTIRSPNVAEEPGLHAGRGAHAGGR